jgi:PAS domain-containing protein
MMGDNKQKDPSPDDARDRFRRNVGNRQASRLNPPCRTTAELLDVLRDLRNQDAGLEARDSALQCAQQAVGALYQQFEDLYERAPCGYLTLNPNGLITRINPAGAILLQGLRENILHTAFSRYIPPSRQNRYLHALRKAVHSNQKQCMELHQFGADGTDMWLWAEIVADGDKAGNLSQWRMTLVDISSKKKAELALKASEQKYRMLFDEMVAGAVIVADVQRDHQGRIKDGRVEQVNIAFERLMGLPRDRIVGSTLRRIWSLDDAFRFDPSDGSMHGYQKSSSPSRSAFAGRDLPTGRKSVRHDLDRYKRPKNKRPKTDRNLDGKSVRRS